LAGFALHPQLEADTRLVGDLPLCRLLLMDDARFPWAILVPRRAGLFEVHHLPAAERSQLVAEAALVAQWLGGLPGITKINHGAIGNMVPQLHWHVVGRLAGDSAWPAPVWGSGPRVPLDDRQAALLLAGLRTLLEDARG
jgi:diadenosine tetraphosphate (Ap4A) HIT family hydrolase